MKSPWDKKRTAMNGMLAAAGGLILSLMLLIAQVFILAAAVGVVSLVALIVSFLFYEDALSEMPYYDPDNFNFETGEYTIS